MNFNVIVESPAQEDIERAFCWIAEESREGAIQWYNDLYEAIESLKFFPARCSLAPENYLF